MVIQHDHFQCIVLGGKTFHKTSFLGRDGPVKKTEATQEWKNQEHHHTTEQWQPPLWP